MACPTLIGDGGIAYLATRKLDERTWQFGAYRFGPDADTLTAELLGLIAAWDRQYRQDPGHGSPSTRPAQARNRPASTDSSSTAATRRSFSPGPPVDRRADHGPTVADGGPTHSCTAWEPDFARLWRAYAASEFGTAVAMGALPLVAVLVLRASDLQVSLLAVLAGATSAMLALPLGPWNEYRCKSPTMIGADLLQFAALGSVPLAAALGVLTAQLCVVTIVQAVGIIALAPQAPPT